MALHWTKVQCLLEMLPGNRERNGLHATFPFPPQAAPDCCIASGSTRVTAPAWPYQPLDLSVSAHHFESVLLIAGRPHCLGSSQ